MDRNALSAFFRGHLSEISERTSSIAVNSPDTTTIVASVEWHSLESEDLFDHIEEVDDLIQRYQQEQKYQQCNDKFRIVWE